MRRLILFLFALLPFAASAQCAPADLSGSGTKAVIDFNTTGGAAAWWCPGRFAPTLTLYAVRWDAMTDPLRADLSALASQPDHAGIERMQAAHATTPLGSDVLRPVWEPAKARMLASRPADPVWLVARNGAYTTRPAYLVVAGPDSLSVIGSTATAARATVGASCACVRLRVVTGPTTYCGIDGESQLVAVCARQTD